jgi:hypothetical protein
MPVLLQVTLGAAATEVSPVAIFVQTLVVQNNSGGDVRVGDSTVSVARGILASALGGSYNTTLNFPRGTILSQWYLAGTPGNVIDVLYEP